MRLYECKVIHRCQDDFAVTKMKQGFLSDDSEPIGDTLAIQQY